jgi:hypothetical protein
VKLNESNNLEEFEIEIQSLLTKTAAKARDNWIQLIPGKGGEPVVADLYTGTGLA